MSPAARRRYRRFGWWIGTAIAIIVVAIATMRAKGNDWDLR
ncbi:hypothetical protein GCM10029976_090630 [Kribbella albertanoniae]|nr:hypothetical protein [Kribbella albertanoniae]